MNFNSNSSINGSGKNFKLVSELIFAANIKNISGNMYIMNAENLTDLATKENIKNTIFMFLPYERDTYISLHILMQDDKWKFLELDRPLEVTSEEVKSIIDKKKDKIEDIEYLPCSVIYMLDYDHIPKEITIKLLSHSSFIAKNILTLQKNQHQYGYFRSQNRDWKYNKED